jgi:uncharacterized SAM-binding protein YcdF (DUF218 family)
MQASSFGWLLDLILLPLAGPLLLAVLGLVLLVRKRRSASVLLLGSGIGLIWLLSLPWVSNRLCGALESESMPPLTEARLQSLMTGGRPPGAVVVVGAGARAAPAEGAAGLQPDAITLERLAQAAWVVRVSGLRLMAAPGAPAGIATPDAQSQAMAASLERAFGQRAAWRQTARGDTSRGAREAAAVLRGAGITRIVLVTHAWQMHRVAGVWRGAGMEVTPAPHGSCSGRNEIGAELVPSVIALDTSRQALAEWAAYVGRFWADLFDGGEADPPKPASG